jgi:S1-C subfamily serine protease
MKRAFAPFCAAVAAALVGMALPALADEDLPDRDKLSYEENLTINMICSKGGQASNGAYEDCVHDQLVELKEHPTPNRAGLSDARFQAILRACADYRNSGFAEYNACLKQAMSAPKAANEPGSLTDEVATNYAAIVTNSAPPKPQAVIPAAAASGLPRPSAVLPKRPSALRGAALTPADVFRRVEHSIYIVVAAHALADIEARDMSIGTAVAITPHLLLTNCHIVDGRGVIKLVQDKTVIDAELVGNDVTADRCVLRVADAALPPVAGVRGFDDLTVGERVYAVGTPFGLSRTLSEGLISGLRPGTWNLIQTSAPISHGSSGGGLFDERGNLIGITTLASRASLDAQNLNFAIAAGDFWD